MWKVLDGNISLGSNYIKEEAEWPNDVSVPSAGADLPADIKQECKQECSQDFELNQPTGAYLHPYMEVTVKVEEEVEPCNEEHLVCVTEMKTHNHEGDQGYATESYANVKTRFSAKQLNVFRNCFVKLEHLCLYEEHYTCKICQKKIISKPSLQSHLLCHTEEPTFKIKRRKRKFCKTCRKPSASLINSLKNMETLCTCKIMHEKKIELTNQSKNDIVTKPFECDDCGKTFKSYFLLSNHQRIHTGEKPFSCPICDKTFAELSNLRRHGRIHTGERPYRCTLCKKQFSHKTNLVTHLRIHTQNKPFECDFCKKQFVHISDLRRHEYVHTRKKPFTCDICMKQFVRKYRLVSHLKCHTEKLN